MIWENGRCLIDLADVIQRKKDKDYYTLGEAFEDIIYDFDHSDGDAPASLLSILNDPDQEDGEDDPE
jgi:hypothetical protein